MGACLPGRASRLASPLEESVAGVYTQRYVWSPVYVNALVLRDQDLSGTGLTATGTVGTDFSRLWAVQDANWNVVALVDGSGTVVERYNYAPFGIVTFMDGSGSVISGSAYGSVYLFQGGRQDAVTGNTGSEKSTLQCRSRRMDYDRSNTIRGQGS